MKKKSAAIALTGVIIFAASAGALASGIEIYQAGRAFSQQEVILGKGGTLVFVNDDNVPHNIYTTFSGSKVDKGISRPGEKTELLFDESGNFLVRCAIHPKMKISVKVQ